MGRALGLEVPAVRCRCRSNSEIKGRAALYAFVHFSPCFHRTPLGFYVVVVIHMQRTCFILTAHDHESAGARASSTPERSMEEVRLKKEEEKIHVLLTVSSTEGTTNDKNFGVYRKKRWPRQPKPAPKPNLQVPPIGGRKEPSAVLARTTR